MFVSAVQFIVGAVAVLSKLGNALFILDASFDCFGSARNHFPLAARAWSKIEGRDLFPASCLSISDDVQLLP